MEPTVFKHERADLTPGAESKFQFQKEVILGQVDVQQALHDLEDLHLITVSAYGHEERDVVNIPELFKRFLDNPDLYRKPLSAKLIVALNESIPQQTEQNEALYRKYMKAWGTIVAKLLHVLASDLEHHQLSESGGSVLQNDEFMLLNFGTLGRRIHLDKNNGQWRLQYHLYPSDATYGSKGFPVAMSRLFPARFFVQTPTDSKPRRLGPDEHVPVIDTSFTVDLRSGLRDVDPGGTSDIDLPPRYTE